MPDVAMSLLYVDDEEHNLSVFRATFRRQYKVFASTRPRRRWQAV